MQTRLKYRELEAKITPTIMLIAPLWAFFAVYFGLALLFSYIEKRFEILANKYAKQQITQS